MKINAVNQSTYNHNSNTNFRAHIVNTPTLQKAIEYASPNWIKELNNTLGKIPDKMLVELNQSSRGYMMCSLKDGANTEIQILTNDIISKEVKNRYYGQDDTREYITVEKRTGINPNTELERGIESLIKYLNEKFLKKDLLKVLYTESLDANKEKEIKKKKKFIVEA